MLLRCDDVPNFLQEILPSAVREIRIDWQIGSACFQDSEQAGDHLQGSLDADSDEAIGGYAVLDKLMGNLVCPSIHLLVGERVAFITDGRFRGATCHLCFEEAGDRRA